MRTTLAGAIEYYKENAPRGEYVLVIEGASISEINENVFWKSMSIDEHLEYYQGEGLKKMDAIKAVAKDRGVAKSEIYKLVNAD